MLHPQHNPQQPYQPQQPYPPQYQPPAPQPTVLPVRTNHALHLVLSVLTCGLWLPGWVVMAMINSSRTRRVY